MNDSRDPFASLDVRAVVSYCAVCESSDGPLEVQELGSREGVILSHVSCGRCGGMALLLAQTAGVAVNAVGLATDLVPEDVRKFRVKKALTADDAIDFHASLVNGGFIKALQPASSHRIRAKNTAKPKKAR